MLKFAINSYLRELTLGNTMQSLYKFTLFFAVFMPFSSFGHAAIAISDVNEIITISKIDYHFAAMEDKRKVLKTVGSSITKIGDENILEKVFEGIFEKNQMLDDSREFIGKNYNEALASKAKSIFSKRLPQKMATLEVEAAKPENKTELKNFLKNMNQSEIEPAMPLIAQINALTFTTDWMVAFIEEMSGNLITITDAMLESRKITSSEQQKLTVALEAQTKSYRDGDPGFLFLLFAYKDVPLNELQQYVDILETEEGIWFMKITRGAIVEGTKLSLKRFGDNFVDVIK